MTRTKTVPLADLRWHTCVQGDPWREDMRKRGLHPDAVKVNERDGYPGGDIVEWHCPTCGVRWTEELPQ